MTIDLNKVIFLIESNGGQQLGNCYYRDNFKIYSRVNPDDEIYGQDRCKQLRENFLKICGTGNVANFLGKFEYNKDTGFYIASGYTETDSSD